jgi:hypothetical protein
VLVAQIKLVHLAGYIESDMTRGYNVRVMNIADDHKPFSHRAPPLTSRLSCCSNSGRRRPRQTLPFTPALLPMSL